MNEDKVMNVSMLGLGYIGLPTAILAAQNGYRVTGYDVDQNKIDQINKAIAPIVEPEIEERLTAVINSGMLTAHSELQVADFYVIAVPTPFKEGKKADLSYVYAAGTEVARILKPGDTIIVESTIPVGTTRRFAGLIEDISGYESGTDFFVAHCPERVLPGRVFAELVSNDRVLGGHDMQASQKAKEFYQPFVKGQLYTTDDAAAEMVKLVENTSRDIQIAFANELAAMCDEATINVHEVIELANKHPRVSLLQPGCGVGGHCIAVDPWFLIETFSDNATILKTARTINDAKPHRVIEKIIEHVHEAKETMRKRQLPKILLLGLTFKPNIDDLRESPALKIARELASKTTQFELYSCEPNVEKEVLEGMRIGNVVSLNEGLEIADIVVALVRHDEFTRIVSHELSSKRVVDTCGLMHTINKAVGGPDEAPGQALSR